TPILPITPLGSPSLRVISFHVSPPSLDLKSPDPGPPLDRYQGPRRACQIAAYRMRGLTGSIARSMAPAESDRNRIFSQVRPPSFERNTPRSGLGPNAWPSTATYTRSALVGWTLMAPIWPASPSPTWAHVLPSSVDLYTPLPGDTLPRIGDSPVPT